MTRFLPRRAFGTALTGCVVAAALTLSPASAETGGRPGAHARAVLPSPPDFLAATGAVAFVPLSALAVAAVTFGFVLYRRARTS